MTKKVLDVGQCNADHSRISDLLTRSFDVQISRAHSHDEALQLATDTPFDLILINRLMDADGSEGMSILHTLKSKPDTSEVPVMIVSNFEDAQNSAVESGAKRGFGKSALDDKETINVLSELLG